MAAETVVCEGPGCEVRFTPQRSTARFHSTTCRSRAARQRKAAEQSVAADEAKGQAEHSLVTAVRTDLQKVDGALESFAGQLALQLARRLTGPDEKTATALSKELRTVMAEALAAAAPTPTPTEGGRDDAAGQPAEPEDELTRIRRERAEARQAAGLA